MAGWCCNGWRGCSTCSTSSSARRPFAARRAAGALVGPRVLALWCQRDTAPGAGPGKGNALTLWHMHGVRKCTCAQACVPTMSRQRPYAAPRIHHSPFTMMMAMANNGESARPACNPWPAARHPEGRVRRYHQAPRSRTTGTRRTDQRVAGEYSGNFAALALQQPAAAPCGLPCWARTTPCSGRGTLPARPGLAGRQQQWCAIREFFFTPCTSDAGGASVSGPCGLQQQQQQLRTQPVHRSCGSKSRMGTSPGWATEPGSRRRVFAHAI
jgi:hypothetical protein